MGKIYRGIESFDFLPDGDGISPLLEEHASTIEQYKIAAKVRHWPGPTLARLRIYVLMIEGEEVRLSGRTGA